MAARTARCIHRSTLKGHSQLFVSSPCPSSMLSRRVLPPSLLLWRDGATAASTSVAPFPLRTFVSTSGSTLWRNPKAKLRKQLASVYKPSQAGSSAPNTWVQGSSSEPDLLFSKQPASESDSWGFFKPSLRTLPRQNRKTIQLPIHTATTSKNIVAEHANISSGQWRQALASPKVISSAEFAKPLKFPRKYILNDEADVSPEEKEKTLYVRKGPTVKSIRERMEDLPGSYRKGNLISRLISNLTLADALLQLQFSKKRIGKLVHDHMRESAVLAAVNHGMDLKNCFIEYAFVGRSKCPKRVFVHGRGKTGTMRLYHHHFNYVITEGTPRPKKKPSPFEKKVYKSARVYFEPPKRIISAI